MKWEIITAIYFSSVTLKGNDCCFLHGVISQTHGCLMNCDDLNLGKIKSQVIHYFLLYSTCRHGASCRKISLCPTLELQ